MNCPKCGAVLNIKCRNCLRCGEVNQYYQGYQQSGVINPINMDNNVINMNSINNNQFNMNVNNNIGSSIVDNGYEDRSIGKISLILCAVFNILVFAVVLFIMVKLLTIKYLFYAAIIMVIICFYFICFQLLLIKARIPWWSILIPVYNSYAFNKLCFGNGWLFIIPILPFILLFIGILSNSITIITFVKDITFWILFIYSNSIIFCLGRRFGRSGLLTLLLSGIIIPSIALSKKYQYKY